MDLETIVKALNLKILSMGNTLETVVRGGYVGDLLSDVMANSQEGDLWITRQAHQNIVAVATLKEHAGIILVARSEPAKETIERAETEGITILVSNLSCFDIAGRLYNLISAKEDKPAFAE